MNKRQTSISQLSPQQRQLAIGFAIVVLLNGIAVVVVRSRTPASRGGVNGADQTNPTLVAMGRQLYDTRCASCHGADLEGLPNWQQPLPGGLLTAPPLDESGPAWRRTDQWLYQIVKAGGQTVAPAGAVSAMPSFGGGLSDEQIWAVLAYIKSTWPQPIQDAQPRT